MSEDYSIAIFSSETWLDNFLHHKNLTKILQNRMYHKKRWNQMAYRISACSSYFLRKRNWEKFSHSTSQIHNYLKKKRNQNVLKSLIVYNIIRFVRLTFKQCIKLHFKKIVSQQNSWSNATKINTIFKFKSLFHLLLLVIIGCNFCVSTKMPRWIICTNFYWYYILVISNYMISEKQ